MERTTLHLDSVVLPIWWHLGLTLHMCINRRFTNCLVSTVGLNHGSCCCIGTARNIGTFWLVMMMNPCVAWWCIFCLATWAEFGAKKRILVDYLLSEAYLCFRFHVGSLVVQDGFDVSGRHYTPYHVRSASSLILCQAALDFDWRHYPIIFFLNFTSCPKCYGGCPAGLFVCVQRWVQVNDCGVDGIVMCRTLKLILYICEALLKDKFNL